MIAWFANGRDGVVSRRISKSHFGRRGSVLLLLLLLTTGELLVTGGGKVGGGFDFIMEVRGKKLPRSQLPSYCPVWCKYRTHLSERGQGLGVVGRKTVCVGDRHLARIVVRYTGLGHRTRMKYRFELREEREPRLELEAGNVRECDVDRKAASGREYV